MLHLARTYGMTIASPMLLFGLHQSLPTDDWSKAGCVGRVDCGHTQALQPSVALSLGEIQLLIAAMYKRVVAACK